MKHALLFCLGLILCWLIVSSSASAQWSQKVLLSRGAQAATTNEDAGQCLAVSGDTIHVVWSDHRSRGYAIYYTRSIDTGVTWSTPVALTDTTGNATFPSIAVSGNSIHLVWMGLIASQRASFYRQSLDGGVTWGAAVCIDSVSAFWPGVAVSGPLVVATLNRVPDSNNSEVYIRRSTNNGASWLPMQRITNAAGRSEDPAIAMEGTNVHLSWNDNRSGTMLIEYNHSTDGGATWYSDTALTSTQSYTSMVALDGPIVNVAYGINAKNNANVGLAESPANGFKWLPDQQITDSGTGGLYPFETRTGSIIHIAYSQFGSNGGARYMVSTDGGATWSAPLMIARGAGQPFIATTGCVVHIVFGDSGQVYYVRNPTGNGTCLTSSASLIDLPQGGNTPIDSALLSNSVCREDTLLNSGSSDMILNSWSVAPVGSSWKINGIIFPDTLKAQERQVITICGLPEARGLQQAVLTINATSNGAAKDVQIPLLMFGEVTCASASESDLFRSVTLRADGNHADTACITISNCGNITSSFTAALSGLTAAEYTLLPSNLTNIAPGGNASICLVFKPSQVGATNDTLTLRVPNGPLLYIPLDGAAASADVAENSNANNFSLGAPFPNPTSGITTVRYTLPEASSVTISLSDVTGKLIHRLLAREVSPGEHAMEIDIPSLHLSNGDYLITLQSGSTRLSRSIVVSK